MNRDSTTTAEVDRAENVENLKNLKNLLEAHAALLHESTGKQYELAKDLASCKDKLDAMQVNNGDSQTQGVPIPVYDPQIMLDEIKSGMIKIKENLAKREADVGKTPKTEPAIFDSFTSALAITSNLFSVMLSGTMIISAHKLARQARDVSTVARFDPLREHPVDERAVDTGRSIRKNVNFGKRCSATLADTVDLGRPALDSETRTYQDDIYEEPPTALHHLRDERASKVQETETHGKVTSDNCSTSSDARIQASPAEQSEDSEDQQSWDRIWNSSKISPLRQEPSAEERREQDVDNSAKKVSSSNSR